MLCNGDSGTGPADRISDPDQHGTDQGGREMQEMSINEEIARATDQYNQAWQNFEWAAPEFVGVAIAELAAAEERLNLLYQLAKREAA